MARRNIAGTASSGDEIILDDSFPGGNVCFVDYSAVDGGLPRLRVKPDLRDTEGFWFYWYFRLSGVSLPRRFLLDLGNDHAIGDLGPAVSFDEGVSWEWVGAESVRGNTATIQIPPGTDSVRVSVAIPYTHRELEGFLAANAYPELRVLRTDPVTVIAAGSGIPPSEPGTQRPVLLCTARHHACETMANYVLEGMLTAAVEGKAPAAAVDLPVVAIPFVDEDGVAAGDQGKNRRPHDHNRDYGPSPRYEGVKTVQSIAESLSGPVIALDLHCPYLCGGETNNHVYCVGTPFEDNDAIVQRFGSALAGSDASPLPVRAVPYLPHGENWNNRPLETHDTCARWMARQDNVLFATTIEIPYALADGVVVTAERARQFGEVLYAAVVGFLNDHSGT